MLSNKSIKKVFSRPGKARGGSTNTCPTACPRPITTYWVFEL